MVTHRLADVDAYCSSYATAKMLKSFANSVKVVLPEGLNTIAEKVSKNFPLHIDSDPNFGQADVIVIVDTNNPLLLSQAMEDVVKSKARKVLIDHHPLASNAKKLADTMFLDTKASSASEIVYRVYKANKVKISKQIAQVLLVGIMADSQHLFLAGSKTIETVNDLCKLGASLEIARKVLMHERDFSERIARLKAARRIVVYSSNNFIVAFSRVGSFHASAARGLLELGADLAVVVGGDDKASKASLRSTQKFYAESKLHLGTDIASSLTDSGGGHPTAASLSVIVGEDQLAEMLMHAIETKLGKLSAIK